MAKEWVMNIANGRFGLTRKDKVGPVAAWIRECGPKTMPEWENFYYERLETFLKMKGINLKPKEYLKTLGKTLYIKISEVMRAEIADIDEKDCIEYIENLVIKRTFEGYITEKQTICEQLQKELGIKIEPAPDEWDRTYNIDFFIKVNKKYIGLQIKPTTFEHAPQYASKWRKLYKTSHARFKERLGGKVFILLSAKEGDEKIIINAEVIDEIKDEIKRLRK